MYYLEAALSVLFTRFAACPWCVAGAFDAAEAAADAALARAGHHQPADAVKVAADRKIAMIIFICSLSLLLCSVRAYRHSLLYI